MREGIKMKCPICNAEMIPGFHATTFYCPNECDLKKEPTANKVFLKINGKIEAVINAEDIVYEFEPWPKAFIKKLTT